MRWPRAARQPPTPTAVTLPDGVGRGGCACPGDNGQSGSTVGLRLAHDVPRTGIPASRSALHRNTAACSAGALEPAPPSPTQRTGETPSCSGRRRVLSGMAGSGVGAAGWPGSGWWEGGGPWGPGGTERLTLLWGGGSCCLSRCAHRCGGGVVTGSLRPLARYPLGGRRGPWPGTEQER